MDILATKYIIFLVGQAYPRRERGTVVEWETQAAKCLAGVNGAGA